VFFDRSQRAAGVRTDAQARAERLLAEAEVAAAGLERQADAAVATLRTLGEPVVEIATMTGLPVSGVRAALTRAEHAAPATSPTGNCAEAAEVQPGDPTGTPDTSPAGATDGAEPQPAPKRVGVRWPEGLAGVGTTGHAAGGLDS
jgi:hypothetical protein